MLDGDTIEVLQDKAPVRIRLYGIDCPEHGQDFGTRAKQFTSDKVFGKTVEVVPVEKDRYERLVAKIYIDGKYLNQMIVAEGFAMVVQKDTPRRMQISRKLKRTPGRHGKVCGHIRTRFHRGNSEDKRRQQTENTNKN